MDQRGQTKRCRKFQCVSFWSHEYSVHIPMERYRSKDINLTQNRQPRVFFSCPATTKHETYSPSLLLIVVFTLFIIAMCSCESLQVIFDSRGQFRKRYSYPFPSSPPERMISPLWSRYPPLEVSFSYRTAGHKKAFAPFCGKAEKMLTGT